MPSISMLTVSPGDRYCGGSNPSPTPDGVPVEMMSPGSSVIASEMNAMTSATEKTMSPHDESWRSSPETVVRIQNVAGSKPSSGMTAYGPIGANVSRLLPRIHCGSPDWRSRALTSSRIVYAPTYASASATATLEARRPMITASSPS